MLDPNLPAEAFKILVAVDSISKKEMHTLRGPIRPADMVKTVDLLIEIIDIHSSGGFQR